MLLPLSVLYREQYDSLQGLDTINVQFSRTGVIRTITAIVNEVDEDYLVSYEETKISGEECSYGK
jgi:hypothetical protein